jgi:hypothetical protein
MSILILHRNEAFACNLKESFLKEGFSHVEIASSEDLSNGFERFKHIIDSSTKLILDAHINGNMSSCEGFDCINSLRLKHRFFNTIILLTWFQWDKDFQQRSFLRKHLEWFFILGYEKKNLSDLKIINLPVSSKKLISEIKNL